MRWVEESGEYNAYGLLTKEMPKMRVKLDRLDKRIQEVLVEVRTVFPDAEYYTASGGFTLVLGKTHINGDQPQQQRSAWGGSAQIGDGDW